jgi:hypothetical protein
VRANRTERGRLNWRLAKKAVEYETFVRKATVFARDTHRARPSAFQTAWFVRMSAIELADLGEDDPSRLSFQGTPRMAHEGWRELTLPGSEMSDLARGSERSPLCRNSPFDASSTRKLEWTRNVGSDLARNRSRALDA